MIRLGAAELARVVGGSLSAEASAEVTGSVQTDSRLVGAGDAFFALPGESTDGHRFAAAAVDAGAVVVVAERPLDLSVPVVVVPDGVVALGALAREVVARVRALGRLRIAGVTGSNGKTTTKNMLRAILSAAGPAVAPEGSFNNEVGAPMTMLRVTEDTAFLIVEMGADAVGDVAKLVGLARPDVGIVLKVGTAHIGKFGSQEAIAEAKGELVRDLPADAVAVLNRDDALVAAMPTAARVRWFGIDGPTGPDDWTASDVRLTLDGTAFTLRHAGQSYPVRLQILGEHHVMNALAALAASDALGVPPAAAIPALEAMERAERWRMELLAAPDGVTVINDAYNASPESTAAALRTLAEVTRGRARSVAVIGEMAELGDWAAESHDRIGRLAVRLNVDRLVVVGEGARAMFLGAQHEGSWGSEAVFAESNAAAYDVVRALLQTGRRRSREVVEVRGPSTPRRPARGHRRGRVACAGAARMIALLMAAGFSLLFTLFLTPLFARLFKRVGWGQYINADGPRTHEVKRGTPTMGGIVFIVGAIVGYLLGHWVAGEHPTMSGLLVIYLMVGLGVIGFIDDFMKTHRRRSLGLGPWQKIVGQVIVAGGFAALALGFPDENNLTPASTHISALRDIPWLDLATWGLVIGGILVAIWVTFLVVATSNGVNLTDGLDGLATGSSIFAFIAYIVVGFWQFNQSCFNPNPARVVVATCYEVRDPLDLAIIAAAITGALLGFLWWNTSPAQIFMGDTGSLGLGGALAALAILSRTSCSSCSSAASSSSRSARSSCSGRTSG